MASRAKGDLNIKPILQMMKLRLKGVQRPWDPSGARLVAPVGTVSSCAEYQAGAGGEEGVCVPDTCTPPSGSLRVPGFSAREPSGRCSRAGRWREGQGVQAGQVREGLRPERRPGAGGTAKTCGQATGPGIQPSVPRCVRGRRGDLGGRDGAPQARRPCHRGPNRGEHRKGGGGSGEAAALLLLRLGVRFLCAQGPVRGRGERREAVIQLPELPPSRRHSSPAPRAGALLGAALGRGRQLVRSENL